MHIIKRKTLMNFWNQHNDSETALRAWYSEVKKAAWVGPADIKKRYGSADFLKGDRVVFNICGNKYRLIVKIAYLQKVIFIRFIGTHKEYSKIDAESI